MINNSYREKKKNYKKRFFSLKQAFFLVEKEKKRCFYREKTLLPQYRLVEWIPVMMEYSHGGKNHSRASCDHLSPLQLATFLEE